MKHRTIILIAFAIAIFLSPGCIRDIYKQNNGHTQDITFTIEEDLREFESQGTKGILADIYCKDDNGMGDISILAYDLETGEYCASCHIENYNGTSDCSLELRNNKTYRIFALVNMGETVPPGNMAEMEKYIYDAGSWDRIVDEHGFLPMAGSINIDTRAGKNFPIYVRRLVAEINIEYSSLDGVKIIPKRVQICNSPTRISPFTDNKPSKEALGDGDMGTDEDLENFENGGTIRMFMLENANFTNEVVSGDLDVQDPSVPVTEQYSWIEFSGRIVNSAGLESARIEYRIILNFKIERNKRYNISFYATDEGIFEDSWRVTVSDAILDMGEEITMVENTKIKFSIPAEEYTEITYESGDESIVTYNNGELFAHNVGKTTIRASSDSPDASGSINVNVISEDDDRIFIAENISATLGIERSILFVSNNDGVIRVVTKHGVLEMDISLEAGGETRIVENGAIRLSFDPNDTKNGKKLGILVKELPSAENRVLNGTIINKSGNSQKFKINIKIPQLTVICDNQTYSEAGGSSQYMVLYKEGNRTLTAIDFDRDVYQSLFLKVKNATSPIDLLHIGIKSEQLVQVGKIYGIAADGINPYKGVIEFRTEGILGNLPEGQATMEVTVLPAFTGNGGNLGSFDNTALYNKNGQDYLEISIPESDITGSSISVRHLGWDRSWEKGTNATNNEINSKETIDGGIRLCMGPDGAGPFALRLTKTSPETGKSFHSTYYFDLYLNLEVGIHFPWNENGRYRLDLEIIFNINKNAAARSKIVKAIDGENHDFLLLSERFESNKASLYPIGTFINSWSTNPSFFYNDTAHALMPLCENFIDSIINQFNKRNFVYELHNPYTDKNEGSGMFVTDRNIAEEFFGGQAILLKFELADSFLYTITHSGCSSNTGMPNGSTETNRR